MALAAALAVSALVERLTTASASEYHIKFYELGKRFDISVSLLALEKNIAVYGDFERS